MPLLLYKYLILILQALSASPDYMYVILLFFYDVLIFHCTPICDKFLEHRPRVYFYKCNTFEDCDVTMTCNSDFDIAWIRSGKEDSYTAKNIKRRYNL